MRGGSAALKRRVLETAGFLAEKISVLVCVCYTYSPLVKILQEYFLYLVLNTVLPHSNIFHVMLDRTTGWISVLIRRYVNIGGHHRRSSIISNLLFSIYSIHQHPLHILDLGECHISIDTGLTPCLANMLVLYPSNTCVKKIYHPQ
jgi:hypothetical protein